MTGVEDKLAVQELVATYNLAWDGEDVDGVVACFVPDGVFVDAAGGEHAGRDAIREFVVGSYRQFGRMRHITSSHLVDRIGTGGARHRCYVVFVSHPEGERVLDTGEYEDTVVRTESGWRFARRVVRFD
jgi:uncharacterized protein (TIGR02246 family)